MCNRGHAFATSLRLNGMMNTHDTLSRSKGPKDFVLSRSRYPCVLCQCFIAFWITYSFVSSLDFHAWLLVSATSRVQPRTNVQFLWNCSLLAIKALVSFLEILWISWTQYILRLDEKLNDPLSAFIKSRNNNIKNLCNSFLNSNSIRHK